MSETNLTTRIERLSGRERELQAREALLHARHSLLAERAGQADDFEAAYLARLTLIELREASTYRLTTALNRWSRVLDTYEKSKSRPQLIRADLAHALRSHLPMIEPTTVEDILDALFPLEVASKDAESLDIDIDIDIDDVSSVEILFDMPANDDMSLLNESGNSPDILIPALTAESSSPELRLDDLLGQPPLMHDSVDAAVRAILSAGPSPEAPILDGTEPRQRRLTPRVSEAYPIVEIPDADAVWAEAEFDEEDPASSPGLKSIASQDRPSLDPFSQLDIQPPDPRVTGRIQRARSPRVALAVSVGIEQDSYFSTGFSADIGIGGLFIATTRPLALNSRLDLFFELPGSSAITVQAEVRWRRGKDARRPGLGTRFIDLEHDARILISRYVDTQVAAYAKR